MSKPKSTILAGSFAVAIYGWVGNLSAAADAPPQGYISFDGGVSRTQGTTVNDGAGNSTRVAFDAGLRFDLRLGLSSLKGLRGEIDVGVLYNALKTNPLTSTGGKLELYQVPIMLDLGYAFRVIGPLSVYFGGGIGAVYGVLNGDGTSLIGVSSDLTFGYQGFGGISYALSDRLDIGVAYKFLGTSSHDWGSGIQMDGTRTHALMAAITMKF